MDNDTALELVKQGANILLLGVPQYTLLGIDTQVFTVGPNFKGIKMIPPGPHFVFYSSSTRDGKEFSPIIGFFCHVGPSEVIVRKWDQAEERLVKVSEQEEESYSEGVRRLEFDKNLGPCDLILHEDWKRLSNYITKSVIERLEPIGGEITVANEPAMFSNAPKTAVEKALDDQLKSSQCSTSDDKSQKRGCYYTSIPRVIKQKGLQGNELTTLNLDKTQLLESLLANAYGGSEDLLLGELQFSFIAFLMGQSLEAFLQWKSMVSLLLGCTEAPFHTRTNLFVKSPDKFYELINPLSLSYAIPIPKTGFYVMSIANNPRLEFQFIRVIYFQLKYGHQKEGAGTSSVACEASVLLDDSWFSADSFLHHLCKDFFSLVEEASVVDGDLLILTRRLKELLENNLRWEFQQQEDDEFAPVVEMLDEAAIGS